ncbi:hypothetical protein EYF80_045589 [Liparis tanakae]|uniref:Uncharacterized protein n=1 Tax=Liparis tanakae TaxID=230148 RepID=A0A4Z2FU10_9TELE|nr:hypothetical protein EYF80_045589 [Liparis tanakae]
MPSLHHGTIFIGAFLIVTGGSTAFLASSQSRLQAFSLCCVVLGVVMLILGLFWAMNSKSSAANYNHRGGEFDPECPHYPYDYPNFAGHALFTPPPGGRFPESQSVFLPRRLDRIRREMSEDSVSRAPEPEPPSLPSTPPPWTMEPPPSYDTVMKSQEHGERL